LTIEGGRHGVRILENTKAFAKVSIKKSNRWYHIDSASRDKKYQALINDVEIEGSDRGIFAEKRYQIINMISTIIKRRC
jgi:hypothetical protein